MESCDVVYFQLVERFDLEALWIVGQEAWQSLKLFWAPPKFHTSHQIFERAFLERATLHHMGSEHSPALAALVETDFMVDLQGPGIHFHEVQGTSSLDSGDHPACSEASDSSGCQCRWSSSRRWRKGS